MIVRLKKIRREKEMSQEELAGRVGVSRQSIYAIESGKFTPTTLLGLKLARELGCELQDIFQLEDTD